MSQEHRKLCILKAVRGLFSQKGLSATSREISEAAGVSEALIYKHFDSKEGLYNALLDQVCHAADEVGSELAEMEASTDVLIMATYLLVHIKISGFDVEDEGFSLSSHEACGLILQSLQTDGEVAQTIFGTGFGPWVKYFVEGLKAAKRVGDLHPTDLPFETLVWITHHAMAGVKMVRHPKKSAFMAEEIEEEKLKERLLIYSLRGMGVKDEAIHRVLKTQEFKKFKKRLSRQGA